MLSCVACATPNQCPQSACQDAPSNDTTMNCGGFAPSANRTLPGPSVIGDAVAPERDPPPATAVEHGTVTAITAIAATASSARPDIPVRRLTFRWPKILMATSPISRPPPTCQGRAPPAVGEHHDDLAILHL